MIEGATESPRGTERGPEASRKRSYALEELTWEEVEAVLASEPRLILPVGALEQHGAHLPLGTNTFIATAVAAALSEDAGILTAPTLSYGVTVPGSEDFPGTATLRRKTLHRAVNELVASWEDHGVQEFIILTAHRYEPHLDALLMALTQSSMTTVVDLYAIDVSDLVECDPTREHAGEVETSLILHLDPERVRRGRMKDTPLDAKQFRKYARGHMPTAPPQSGGTAGRPSLATDEKGRKIFQRWLERLREAVL